MPVLISGIVEPVVQVLPQAHLTLRWDNIEDVCCFIIKILQNLDKSKVRIVHTTLSTEETPHPTKTA